jgi:cellulose synthase/poly-beta-1,6-N-acetylglucosamine synthase-like glycosyltransferase
LLQVGRWAEWCITEDSELGLSLYEAGYDSVYVNRSLGQGLMPDTFSAYKGQRFRWVYGAMQIIKKHWRSFLPTQKTSLTAAQRYYFLAGWLPWFSDALALIFTLASLVLTGVLLYDPVHTELPSTAFLLPTVGIFSFKIIRGLWLYRARVPCSILQTLGSFLAGLSLTHTVARGVLQGLFTHNKPFLRTPKNEKRGALLTGAKGVWQELVILVALATSITAIASAEYFANLIGWLWITILTVQMVPYLATLIMLLISIYPSKQK